MDFSAPSFSLGLDFDEDPTPEDDSREGATGYVAPDAPTFSLGLDFDCYDDDDDEPQIPASGIRSEGPARRYEAPDAPSFSLGLDFDDDDDAGASEPQIPARGPREEEERPRRYEAPDAPPFSLGIDHDDDDDVGASEPRHLPFGGRREEPPPPPPRYKAPDATQVASEDLSWLDDGDELLPAGGQRPDQSRGRALDSGPLLLQPETTRLKRLRRGPAPRSMAPPPSRAPAPVATEASPDISRDAAMGAIGSYEDEIEDFTDEESPRGMPPSVGSCRTSSNSKFSLLNRSVLMTQSTNKTQTTKATPLSNSFASKPLEESCTKKLLPKITVSPLRKIYFLDSDTDSDDNKNQRKAKKPASPIKKRQESMHKYMQKKPILQQSSKSEGSTVLQKSKDTMDSWATPALDEFCSEYLQQSSKSAGRTILQKSKDTTKDSWATPALDEFCSEYLQQSSKSAGRTILQKSKDTTKDSWATGSTILQQSKDTMKDSWATRSTILQQSKDTMKDSWATPALDEFCSEYFKSVQDSRPSRQKNVSSISGSKVSRPYSSVSEIGEHFRHESTSSGVVLEENLTDSHPPAMHYFFHHDQRVQELVRERLKHFVPIGAGTTQGNEYSVEENLNYRTQFGQSGAANDQWVTPNRRTSVPTDFGKRRVHAGGTQSGSGHWFTGEDGRKVYVSKNGQELTGRDAYKQYKKERGKGFRNYKKKSTVKKEGSARAKRGSSTSKKASSSSTAKRSSTTKRKR